MSKNRKQGKRSPKASKKRSCRAPSRKVVFTPLDLHNAKSYMEDMAVIANLAYISPSRRDWIETNRYKLQNAASKCEHRVGEYLLDKGIKFIHQAPFIVYGRIYFADFFLPQFNRIIEVDGKYHQGFTRSEKDADRDVDFRSIGIKTIRVTSGEAMNDSVLDTKLRAEGIVARRLKPTDRIIIT